jgi:hypothetical protein
VKDGSFVHLDTAVVDSPSERDFIGVKIVEARSTGNFMGLIAQDVDDGLRSIKNVRFGSEV